MTFERFVLVQNISEKQALHEDVDEFHIEVALSKIILKVRIRQDFHNYETTETEGSMDHALSQNVSVLKIFIKISKVFGVFIKGT